MNRFTAIALAAAFFTPIAAHAGAYDVTECYGGDYRWVVSLDRATNKATATEFTKGEFTKTVDGTYVMGAGAWLVQGPDMTLGFNTSAVQGPDDQLRSEWLCRPFVRFHKPFDVSKLAH
jgi:hypothetical protein